MDFNKLPRWLLVWTAIGFFGLVGLVGNNLYADNQKVKTVAYSARSTAETCSLQVAALSGQIQEIKNSQETFRKEYREDQRDVQFLLKEIIKKS